MAFSHVSVINIRALAAEWPSRNPLWLWCKILWKFKKLVNLMLIHFSLSLEIVGRLKTGRWLLTSSLESVLKMGFTLDCFHRLGKIPELRVLLIIMLTLEESPFEAILSNLGPIQSSPVALVVSRFDKNFLTTALLVSGILKYVSGLAFEFTWNFSFSKSDIWIGSLNWEATLTKQVLKISTISFSSELKFLLNLTPSILSCDWPSAPKFLNSFQMDRGSTLPFSVSAWCTFCLEFLIKDAILFLRILYWSKLPFILHLFLSLIWSRISGVI